ncbi:MAG: thiamine-phosphate kinase [Nitrososphaerales archaeon]|nr:thiamine-phosphate kinase [Nitrososphaerales archaeon]
MEIIGSVLRFTGRLPRGYGKIGDDVAIVPVAGKKLVLKVDMLVESTDVPRGMTFRQAGRKAVAMCVSDFAAKGVKPDSYMVSLGVPKKMGSRDIDDLALGFRDASREWAVRLVGGDTNEAKELVVDCTMVGFGGHVVGRGGAKQGDIVATTGLFGCPPAGLQILIRGAKAAAGFRRAAVKSVLSPTPNLRLGLALAGFWTSSMDSSDGLARSLHALARASGVGMEIHTLPTADGVEEFAKANKLSARRLVLEGGEEYLIVGTMKARRFSGASRVAERNGGRIFEIGRVTGRSGRVTLRSRNGTKPIEDAGWVHLR